MLDMTHDLDGRTRDRAPRGPDRWVRAAAAVAVVGGLAACGTQAAPLAPGAGDPPAIPPAEVAASGPDCLADDVVTSLTGMSQDSGHAGPATGSVPPDFAPVDVVQCRVSWADLLEPERPTLAPHLDGSDPEAVTDVPEPGDDHLEQLTVEEVTLTGDLGPLLEALARPSDPPSSGACIAMFEFQPVVFLVDATGRAVRPQWPVDGCGFLHDGAAEALASLTEGDSTVHQVDRCVDGCSTGRDD